ncbi:MAG: polysaccharide deacetylase family protein [Bacteroidetes bacterium]|nr:polysaccharide deacetylase family protein [Bacteroidota bacterium]
MQQLVQIHINERFQKPAVSYTLAYLLGNQLGLRFEQIPAKDQSISLSINGHNSSLNLGKPHGILSMLERQLDLESWQDFNAELNAPKALVQTESELKIDLLSLIFFCLSRYEEYVVDERDEHGRFLAKNSLLFKWQKLQFPIVDHWVNEFRKVIQAKWPHLKLKSNAFTCVNTLDIDQAYLAKGKPISKVIYRLVTDILKFDCYSFSRRFKAKFTGIDPFDLQFLPIEQMKNPLVFLQMGNNSGFDQNIWNEKEYFKKAVIALSNRAEIGIHPSYSSNQNLDELKNEIKLLNEMVGPVSKSRNHFLKLQIPQTWQKLVNANISDDYTMGYAHEIGFRAGTSKPFSAFDLEKNEPLNLTIVPFCVMDVTLKNYLGLDAEQAKKAIEQLMNTVYGVNGQFCSLWHNESLSKFGEWKNWFDVYSNMLKHQNALLNKNASNT